MTNTTPRRRFPRDVWNQLTAIDTRLLDELAFLSRLTQQQSPRRASYCVPGRAWLAQRLNCSVETITRHTRKLRDLGLLDKLQRRPVAGRWQTCLYRLIHPAAWKLAALRQRIVGVANRLSKVTALAPRPTAENMSSNPSESLQQVLQRGRRKFAPT